ncbi:hypothetical protein [Orenia marismortui]|uniref:Uncharacterized protein n=1 Tax=Orenia marismortui TaxID=46469 RepID=A0A4R8GYN9_9FIRM|nr:hypothetical protein [Orenia marismortui]TDX51657.1 hypothetical protein C7959_11153 [Orenia marismortui]
MIFHYESRNENILDDKKKDAKKVLAPLKLKLEEKENQLKEDGKSVLLDMKYESRLKMNY